MEALVSDGLLSDIIAEVTVGITNAQNLISEKSEKKNQESSTRFQKKARQESKETENQRLLETKRKMLNAIGSPSMSGIFEGTEPLSSGGNPSAPSPSGPLANIDPKDEGVNIDGLFSLVGKKWDTLK